MQKWPDFLQRFLELLGWGERQCHGGQMLGPKDVKWSRPPAGGAVGGEMSAVMGAHEAVPQRLVRWFHNEGM